LNGEDITTERRCRISKETSGHILSPESFVRDRPLASQKRKSAARDRAESKRLKDREITEKYAERNKKLEEMAKKFKEKNAAIKEKAKKVSQTKNPIIIATEIATTRSTEEEASVGIKRPRDDPFSEMLAVNAISVAIKDAFSSVVKDVNDEVVGLKVKNARNEAYVEMLKEQFKLEERRQEAARKEEERRQEAARKEEERRRDVEAEIVELKVRNARNEVYYEMSKEQQIKVEALYQERQIKVDSMYEERQLKVESMYEERQIREEARYEEQQIRAEARYEDQKVESKELLAREDRKSEQERAFLMNTMKTSFQTVEKFAPQAHNK